MRVKIITLVVGSLGAINKQFGNRLESQPTGVTAEIVQVQKTVFLGMTTILRNVLKISAKSKLVNIQTNDW